MILCNTYDWVEITSLCLTILGLLFSVAAIVLSSKSNKLAMKAFDTSSKIEMSSIRNQYFEALKPIIVTLRMAVLSYKTKKLKIVSDDYLSLS